ncbi:FAD-dependent monooxygenase [Brumimicrobium mesophilum]|uniref:FAD-dependent monooxygenase n=1 Tax=Brumimicrobium mesophilum TaxID=392717 RepID=UPI000D1445F8|nr:FAD-dependent monooxygenase [Brumimicrobium mesophilum]
MKITIIGAGIGGLTSAIALQQKGFEVEIFDSTPEFKKVGSGINLAINAMQVFKELGLYDQIYETGSYTRSMKITDEQLAPISTIDLTHFEIKFNVKSVAIHRASLHQILLNQLNDVSIHLDKKVENVTQTDNGIDVYFKDGTKHHTAVLIGSDGVHSAIRKSIIDNSHIRNAKQICWRGITTLDLPEKYQSELNEAWGKGRRFGFVAISKNEYYWYALASYEKNYQSEFQDIDLVDYYSDFNPIVGEIIKSTLKENIITNEMLDLKPISIWYKNNICLLGDSAHATTPNLGQGACQAIESSLVLANCLEKHQNPEEAFRAFQKTRRKKAVKVVTTSYKVGKISHIENRFLIKVRNFLMRNINAGTKQSEQLFKI